MGAFDLLFVILGEGQEGVEALVAVVADKIVGWHEDILTESDLVVERDALYFQS